MRKNILLIVLMSAIFVFVGAMSNSAKAADDPVEAIRNAKTPVHLHSLAGGTVCDPPYSDSLVHDLDSMICTWWHAIYPPNVFCDTFHVIDERDNGNPGLNPSDKLRLHHVATSRTIWVHVEEVTKTLILTKEPDHLDTMYVEYTGGYDSLINPLTDPDYHPVCTWWHEVWPNWCQRWHINSWIDDPSNPDGMLSCCDTIDMAKEEDIEWWHVVEVIELPTLIWLKLENPENPADTMSLSFFTGGHPDSIDRALHHPVCTYWHEEWPDYCDTFHIKSWHEGGGTDGLLDSCDTLDIVNIENITWWHVQDVAIDIEVQSIPDPTVPTMTQWGVIVLALLIVASAIFIMLRRRRVTVPA